MSNRVTTPKLDWPPLRAWKRSWWLEALALMI